jgi:hypothetical protein
MRKQIAGFYLKELTGNDYIQLSDNMPDDDATNSDFIRAMAEFSSIAIVKEDGSPVYETAKEWLTKEKYSVLEKCGNAVLDVLTVKAVDDEVKN